MAYFDLPIKVKSRWELQGQCIDDHQNFGLEKFEEFQSQWAVQTDQDQNHDPKTIGDTNENGETKSIEDTDSPPKPQTIDYSNEKMPLSIIYNIFQVILDEKENREPQQQQAPTFSLDLLEKITKLRSPFLHTNLQTILHVTFLENLFLFYGPSLIYSCSNFFKRRSGQCLTQEYVNVL